MVASKNLNKNNTKTMRGTVATVPGYGIIVLFTISLKVEIVKSKKLKRARCARIHSFIHFTISSRLVRERQPYPDDDASL